MAGLRAVFNDDPADLERNLVVEPFVEAGRVCDLVAVTSLPPSGANALQALHPLRPCFSGARLLWV